MSDDIMEEGFKGSITNRVLVEVMAHSPFGQGAQTGPLHLIMVLSKEVVAKAVVRYKSKDEPLTSIFQLFYKKQSDSLFLHDVFAVQFIPPASKGDKPKIGFIFHREYIVERSHFHSMTFLNLRDPLAQSLVEAVSGIQVSSSAPSPLNLVK